MTEYKLTISGLERERDFYFSKLRDIEVILQTQEGMAPEVRLDVTGLVKEVQRVLYMTEEGFEVPQQPAAVPEVVEQDEY